MKNYQHIFFDLDHTLWDFETNSSKTLSELYQRFDLSSKGAESEDHLIEQFNIINNGLWDKYNKGEISQYYLRNSRFPQIFNAIGVNSKLCPEHIVSEFNECYLKECSQKANLIDGALEVLEHLNERYVLHIITNGFEEVQGIKMKSAGITHYFEEVITSERAGAKKPFPAIYDFALKVSNAKLDQSIMIGDNLSTDIQGAMDYGMDQVYFNPDFKVHNVTVTHEIDHLKQLLKVL